MNTRRPPRPILIVSAFPPELAPLRKALRRRFPARAEIVCLPVGIGAIAAAVGASMAIVRLKPRLVLFVGTGGAYGETPPIGGVAIAHTLLLVSTAAERHEGYLPPSLGLTAPTDPIVRRALLRAAPAGAVAANVVSTLAITRSASLARRLAARTTASIENLETFAVARAALTARIPFAAVLGIANRVGPRAHAEWVRHQAAATTAACAVVESFLRARFTAPSRSPVVTRPLRRS